MFSPQSKNPQFNSAKPGRCFFVISNKEKLQPFTLKKLKRDNVNHSLLTHREHGHVLSYYLFIDLCPDVSYSVLAGGSCRTQSNLASRLFAIVKEKSLKHE